MNSHKFLILFLILFSWTAQLLAQDTEVVSGTDTSGAHATSTTTAIADVEEAEEIIEEHNPACANGKPEGPSDAPSACDPDVAGPHLFSAYSGNAHTSSKDIQVWGSVGENGLHFTRYHNTRLNNMTIFEGRFGQQSGWTHNFQYFLRSTPHYHDRPSFQVGIPKGGDIFFVQSEDDENLYVPAASVPYRLYRNAENPNLLTLEDANRQLAHFEQKARMHYPEGQTYYRLHSLEDSIGNTTSVHYDHWYDDVLPKKITEPAGRHFWIVYQKYGRLVQMQSQLGGIPHAETPGTWKEITVENGQAFRWLSMMYENNYKNEAALAISEIEFYDENNQQIVGTPFGSDPAYSEGQEYDKAFDGDLSTYFRYAYERNGYAGIDLGEGVYKKVSKIRYFLPELAGVTTSQAKFVGLTGSDTLQGYGDYVVKEIRASDGRSVIYNYENFTDPSGLFSWMVLDTVEYPDGTQADYSYTQLHDYSRPVLEDIFDPRVEGCAPMLSYGYNKNGALGFINNLSSSESAEVIATAGAEGSHTSLFYYGEEGGVSERTDFQQDNALPLEHTDANGNTYTYTYNQGGIGYLASTRYPDGNTVSYQRDEFGRLIQESDDGKITYYSRDEKGRLTVTGSFLNGQRISKRFDYKYDERGRLIQKAHKDGDNGLVLEFEAWTYNDFGQVLTHRNMDGSTESWKYYPNGLLQEFTDALGNVNGYSYDNLHRQTHHWNALGRLTLREFNDRGQVTKITDHQSGNTQEFDFDDFGRLIAKTDQSGATWQYSYNEFGQLLSETDPLGHSTNFNYALTSAALTDCNGCAIEKLPLTMTSPEGRVTEYSYDANWNLLSKTIGAGGDQEMTITFTQDTTNNSFVSTEPYVGQGGGNNWEGNSFGNSTDQANSSNISFSVASASSGSGTGAGVGFITTSTTPNVSQAANGDSIAQAAQEYRDSVTLAAKNYHESVALVAQNPDNSIALAAQKYHASIALAAQKYHNSIAQAAQNHRDLAIQATQVYRNTAGQITQVTGSNSDQESSYSKTIEYTNSGQVSKVTENTQESETTQTTEFEYDSLGRLTKTIHPDGSFEEWVYNQLGSAIQYRDRNGVVKTSTYNALEQEITSTWDDGRPSVAREFDAVGRLLSAANAHISSSYQYDLKGQLLSITHQQNQGSGANSANSYAYDKDGALVSVTYPSGHLVEHQLGSAALANSITLDGGAPLAAYTRSDSGLITQRLLENGTQTNYLYDSTPQVNGIEHLNGSGEVIASFDYSSADDQTLSYQPDYLLSTNEEGASYSYDPQGRPITKTLNGNTTLYHWGARQLLEEQDASAQAERAYIYGAQDLPELLTIIEADNSSYAHQDSQNNVIALTDQNGEISEATIIDDNGAAMVLNNAGNDITEGSLLSSIQNTQSVISNSSATDNSSYVGTGTNIGSSSYGSNDSTTSSIILDPVIASNNSSTTSSASNANQVSYNPANIQNNQTTDPDGSDNGGGTDTSGTTDSDPDGNSSSSGDSGNSSSGGNSGGDDSGNGNAEPTPDNGLEDLDLDEGISIAFDSRQGSASLQRFLTFENYSELGDEEFIYMYHASASRIPWDSDSAVIIAAEGKANYFRLSPAEVKQTVLGSVPYETRARFEDQLIYGDLSVIFASGGYAEEDEDKYWGGSFRDSLIGLRTSQPSAAGVALNTLSFLKEGLPSGDGEIIYRGQLTLRIPPNQTKSSEDTLIASPDVSPNLNYTKRFIAADIDLYHPVTGLMADPTEDSSGGVVAIKTLENGNDTAPITRLVIAGAHFKNYQALRGVQMRLSFNSGGRYEIYSDADRTMPVISGSTVFDGKENTVLYIQGLQKSEAPAAELITQQIQVDGKWYDGDSLKFTVVQAEIPIQARAFIPYAWTEGEFSGSFWGLEIDSLPINDDVFTVAGGDDRDFSLSEVLPRENTRVLQKVVITPYKELHQYPDKEAARKAEVSPVSHYYDKNTDVPESERSEENGYLLIGDPDNTFEPVLDEARYENFSRNGSIVTGTIVASGQPGMPSNVSGSIVPNIDWEVECTVDVSDPANPLIKVKGSHNKYPAYEIISKKEDGAYRFLHQYSPNRSILPGPISLNTSHSFE